MMMKNPNDNLFQDMLADYAAPMDDDGFTRGLLENIEAETKRTERIRRFSIYGACFAGGTIAATQLPGLAAMVSKLNVTLPTVPETGALQISTWSIAGVVLLGFVLWAALDRKASEIF